MGDSEQLDGGAPPGGSPEDAWLQHPSIGVSPGSFNQDPGGGQDATTPVVPIAGAPPEPLKEPDAPVTTIPEVTIVGQTPEESKAPGPGDAAISVGIEAVAEVVGHLFGVAGVVLTAPFEASSDNPQQEAATKRQEAEWAKEEADEKAKQEQDDKDVADRDREKQQPPLMPIKQMDAPAEREEDR